MNAMSNQFFAHAKLVESLVCVKKLDLLLSIAQKGQKLKIQALDQININEDGIWLAISYQRDQNDQPIVKKISLSQVAYDHIESMVEPDPITGQAIDIQILHHQGQRYLIGGYA